MWVLSIDFVSCLLLICIHTTSNTIPLIDFHARAAQVRKLLVRGDIKLLAQQYATSGAFLSRVLGGHTPMTDRSIELLHGAERLIAQRIARLNSLPKPVATEEVPV
jgi:hypothetical protein